MDYSVYCRYETNPRDVAAYFRSKKCGCRCEKLVKLDIYMFYQLFKRMTSKPTQLGNFLSWFFYWEKKYKINLATTLTNPQYLAKDGFKLWSKDGEGELQEILEEKDNITLRYN